MATRIKIKLTHEGRTMLLKEWETETGISRHVLKKRKSLGWPDSKSLTTPVNKKIAKKKSIKKKTKLMIAELRGELPVTKTKGVDKELMRILQYGTINDLLRYQPLKGKR